MTELRLLPFVLALMVAPFVAHASDAGGQPQRIDELMKLMAVDEVTQRTLELARHDPQLDKLPENVKACILDVVGGGQLREIMRTAYLKIFSSDRIQQDTIVFLESSAGKKLIDPIVGRVLASDSMSEAVANGRNAQVSMTNVELAQLDRFVKTEAGRAFMNAPEVMKKHRDEVVPQLVRQCVTKN